MINKKNKNVASMVMQILPQDCTTKSDNNYINFSININNAEEAAVALMAMQQLEKLCLTSRPLGSNPGCGASALSIFNFTIT